MTKFASTYSALVGALGVDPTVRIAMATDPALIEATFADFDAAESADAFLDFHGRACPASLVELLALPDTVDLVWRSSDAAGEFHLTNPYGGASRHPDASYGMVAGHDIAAFSILDQVTDIAGPWFVLYDIMEVDEAGLLLFDGRSIAPLALTPSDYAELSLAAAGCDSWAFLFADFPLAQDRRKAIARSVAKVRELVPGAAIERLATLSGNS